MARGAFWTIIVDDQPTAFRAAVREDLLPTLKQLQRHHPAAVIKWFQRGQLWETPGDAMDAQKPPRRGPGWRPGGAHKDPREQYKVPRDVKRARWASQAAEGRGPWVKGANAPERRSTGAPGSAERRAPSGEGRGGWKPKGPGIRGAGPQGRAPRADRPAGDRPAWKPKGDAAADRRPPRTDWRGDRAGRADARPRASGESRSGPPSRKPEAKAGRTWRAGEPPPADRRKKKSEE